MALHPDFRNFLYTNLNQSIHWFQAIDALRRIRKGKCLLPLRKWRHEVNSTLPNASPDFVFMDEDNSPTSRPDTLL